MDGLIDSLIEMSKLAIDSFRVLKIEYLHYLKGAPKGNQASLRGSEFLSRLNGYQFVRLRVGDTSGRGTPPGLEPQCCCLVLKGPAPPTEGMPDSVDLG